MHKIRPRIEEYWSTLAKVIPDFPPDQQRVGMAIYRALAKGDAVSAEQLAETLGQPIEVVNNVLSRDPIRAFIYPDENGRILGFVGIAAAPMHHEFHVNGQRLWTWCAWDGLFIPAALGQTATVASRDPESGEIIRLTVSPAAIERVEPRNAVVSLLLPEADDFHQSAENWMARFCHYVFFFASLESGQRWANKHKGTLLCTVEEAFELGQRLVAKQFGHEIRLQTTA